MKYGKIIIGNIRYNRSDDYTEVEEITGWLYISGDDVRKAFPKLKKIGGSLDVRGADTRIAFPKLTTVGLGLYANGADTRTAFPELTTIGGWLNVSGSDTRAAFPKLTVIGGWLNPIGADTRKAFPKLTAIGGWLDVDGDNTLTAFPNLKTIGGKLYAHGTDTLTAFPKLTVIGGKLYDNSSDTRKAFPKLKHKNSYKAKQIARKNLSRSLLKSGYMLQDGILSRHLASRKLANGLIVHTGTIVGKENKSYVIETPDGVYAHGDTVKQAREALLYKLSENRDTTPYKAWTLDTSITKRQAIQSYMAITGACAIGTRHFVETRFGDRVPARTTVREVIEMTAGQYGSNVYKKFFSENKSNV
ncbi:MAG: hypothetical protein M0P69_09235 [Bacteroidales bacterium]|nr:hypothetical protein [Bacteroidales bacterium]